MNIKHKKTKQEVRRQSLINKGTSASNLSHKRLTYFTCKDFNQSVDFGAKNMIDISLFLHCMCSVNNPHESRCDSHQNLF